MSTATAVDTSARAGERRAPVIRLQAQIDAALMDAPRPLRVLEAGCGSTQHVGFGDDAELVGIDISREQLDDHTALDERIVGDVQSHDLGTDAYDAIVCWDVLEHLDRPTDALVNFARAVRPGGVIVLAMPHVKSVKGLVTKYTPHRVHVLVYRHLFGYADAGKTHAGPFPTTLRASLEPRAVARLAREHGLEATYVDEYEAWPQRELRERLRIRGRAWSALRALTRTLSLGRVRLEVTDVTILLRKPAR